MEIQRLTEILTDAYYEVKNNLDSPNAEHVNNNAQLYADEIKKIGSKKLSILYNYIIDGSDKYEQSE
jgi:hypothetical protein